MDVSAIKTSAVALQYIDVVHGKAATDILKKPDLNAGYKIFQNILNK